ncbi:MAG: hypothetical protein IJG84_17410 [Kiritimatiellae bacterium]|nr:hypothetical protein [Kiritimatiellia bacterium]
MKRKCDFRVLFVTWTKCQSAPYLDPSVRYRCYNPAEVMADMGCLADVVTSARLEARMMEHYDAFVFHRPPGDDDNQKRCLERANALGKPCVADYDDLTFDPAFAFHSSAYRNGRISRKRVLEVFEGNKRGLQSFDRFTVATGPLADRVVAVKPGAEVCVVHNGLSPDLVASFPALESMSLRRHAARKVLSYLSGTPTHIPDIGFVAGAIAKFLDSRPDFGLAIMGNLNDIPGLDGRRGVHRVGMRDFDSFFQHASAYYANLAPLAPDSMFNECKSAIKFFESGVWGVPTIAYPNADFRRFSDSKGLLFAKSPESWLRALEKISDDGFYREATEGLRDYCLRNCMATEPARRLLAFLQGGGAK